MEQQYAASHLASAIKLSYFIVILQPTYISLKNLQDDYYVAGMGGEGGVTYLTFKHTEAENLAELISGSVKFGT